MSIIIGHARYSILDIRYSMIYRNTQLYKLSSKNELLKISEWSIENGKKYKSIEAYMHIIG